MTMGSFQICGKRVDDKSTQWETRMGTQKRDNRGGDPLTEDKVLFHPRELELRLGNASLGQQGHIKLSHSRTARIDHYNAVSTWRREEKDE